jgi:ADP-ribose pyrophosphatase YjhB (NUDIX family)
MHGLNLFLRSTLTWVCAASILQQQVSTWFKMVPLRSLVLASHKVCGWRLNQRIPTASGIFLRKLSSDTILPQVGCLSMGDGNDENQIWEELLPFSDSSHNSANISIPLKLDDNDVHFHPITFSKLLGNTITALRDMNKSSVWVEVPMSRARLIEDMQEHGFKFHHAEGTMAKLNLWLRQEIPSKVPEYATHHLGVGAVVINSRDEILCIRELRQNFMPYKIPTGLSERGESIAEAAEREVLEETGIRAKFDSILSFRQTHGMAHDRSDIFFVCLLNPVEEKGKIPIPVPQACEIAEAKWLSLSEYRDMIDGVDDGKGHPMMSFVMNHIFDQGHHIDHQEVRSVVPGRQPTRMYFPKRKDR